MSILVFEDDSYRNFYPLTYTKPLYELLCGGRRQRERMIDAFGREDVVLLARGYLEDAVRERVDVEVNDVGRQSTYLVVNGGVLMGEGELIGLRDTLETGEALYEGDRLIAVRADRRMAEEVAERATADGEGLLNVARKGAAMKKSLPSRALKYPWQLIDYNHAMIQLDFMEGMRERWREEEPDLGKHPVLLGEGVEVERGSLLEALRGPVVVDDGAEIQFPSRISGPSWIGRRSVLHSALIREGTSIGEVCKVGGEVEASIIEGHSNKAHMGYLGHSYVGEWVNMGASSVVSNLKNTYGTVKVNVDGRRMDSGRMKLGVFLADYSKVSISTAIYAGKRVGVSSHIHGVVDVDVPSFTLWGKSLGWQPREIFLDSAIETQRRIFDRRGIEQKVVHVDLMRRVFEMTEAERMRMGVKRG